MLQRLCEMGFVPGVSVRVVRYAPLGDPMEVELYGSHVSLRKSEAALLRVRLEDPSWGVTQTDRASREGVSTDLSMGGVGALEPACPTS